jgi:TnpA family transposase
MPRRSILSRTERESLIALPDTKEDLIRHYTFSETDLSIIAQRRGRANRLGFAVQLCYMRYPGVMLAVDEEPSGPMLRLVAEQLKVPPESWADYGRRAETRREHLLDLQSIFGFQTFTTQHHRPAVQSLDEPAWQTDKGIVLAMALVEGLRRKSVLLPSPGAIEHICAEAITRANRRSYSALTEPLSDAHRKGLDESLTRRDNSKTTWLAWLRQSPARPSSRHMLEHIERLKVWQALNLPCGIERRVHQNRLLKIAREGAQMTPADLAKFESQRRYATLVTLAVEGLANVTDEIIDLHDRILGKLFNVAKNKHQKQFQASGKAINDKVRLYGQIGQALLDGKQTGSDPFAAIEAVIPWDAFAESVTEARQLAQPEDFDFLHRIGESYATLRRYAPYHTKVINVGIRDSTYVLDGLLYHESDLRIEEHYTDTAGFTDHVFAPRIRDLGDKKLYIPKGDVGYDGLKPMIGRTLNIVTSQ